MIPPPPSVLPWQAFGAEAQQSKEDGSCSWGYPGRPWQSWVSQSPGAPSSSAGAGGPSREEPLLRYAGARHAGDEEFQRVVLWAHGLLEGLMVVVEVRKRLLGTAAPAASAVKILGMVYHNFNETLDHCCQIPPPPSPTALLQASAFDCDRSRRIIVLRVLPARPSLTPR